MKMWISLASTQLTQAEIELLNRDEIAGIVIFRENIISHEQLAALTVSVKAHNPTLEIAIDHEGGRINRLVELGVSAIKSANTYYQLWLDDPDMAKKKLYEDCLADFQSIKDLGIDRTFGPCIDHDNRQSSIISRYERSYGEQSVSIFQLGKVFMQAAADVGLKVCLKHFPDHGLCQDDSHIKLPLDQRTADDVAKITALYQKLVDESHVDMVMVAHLNMPNYLDHTCITFDPNLMKDIPKGVASITDCLSMGAITGSINERITAALAAGHQHVMYTHVPAEKMLGILDQLTQSAVHPSQHQI